MISKHSRDVRVVSLVMHCAMVTGLTSVAFLVAQEAQPKAVTVAETTIIDSDGAAHITRVLPLPRTVSPEAQARPATGATWAPGPNGPETAALMTKARQLYPVKIEEDKWVAGVKTKFVTPSEGVPAGKKNRILINLHGGGFTVDWAPMLRAFPLRA